MKNYLHISDIIQVIEDRLARHHQNKEQLTSLTEHIHHRTAVDTLLLIKNELILKTKLHLK